METIYTRINEIKYCTIDYGIFKHFCTVCFAACCGIYLNVNYGLFAIDVIYVYLLLVIIHQEQYDFPM